MPRGSVWVLESSLDRSCPHKPESELGEIEALHIVSIRSSKAAIISATGAQSRMRWTSELGPASLRLLIIMHARQTDASLASINN